MKNDIFDDMVRAWGSPVVARREAKKFSGGIADTKALANADCEGRGPKGKFNCGRFAVYPAESLAAWLRAKSSFKGKDQEASNEL